MVDRSLPFHNVIMRCDSYERTDPDLPTGYSIVSYQQGFEKQWAALEFALGDFESPEEAENYFVRIYLQEPHKRDCILFALDPQGDVVGSCIAWQDPRHDGCWVSSLHWLVVDSAHQGKGLGRALCVATMNKFAQFPVYIHTQPWSWKAILLYASVGFHLQKTDTFAQYHNEYDQAMATVQKVIPADSYQQLLDASED